MPDDLPPSIERGFGEIEDNYFITRTEEGDIPDLEDINGIGPSTADKLRRAGIQNPKGLYGYSQSQIASIDGIGPKTAAKIRQELAQTGARTRDRGFRNEDLAEARDKHAERNAVERRTDESFNAEIALDYDTWSNEPNQFDMPGVDTIPRERRLERTKKAAKPLASQGLLEGVEASASGPKDANVQGTATGGTARIKTAQEDPESTLAHEFGHIADKVGGGRAGLTQEIFGGTGGEAESEKQENLRKEGAKLASRRRKGGMLDPDWVVEKAEERSFGGGGFDEVFADAFAEMVEEPRRAKKEAPNLVEEIERKYEDESDNSWTPF